MDIVLFRQSTRKQERLDAAWGRLHYRLEIGRPAGAAIILESGPIVPTRRRFSRSLGSDEAAELERFRQYGYEIVEHRRGFDVLLDMAGQRKWQLYHTVLHEVGHYVDYLEKVEWPSPREPATNREWELREALQNRFWQRPEGEHEVFAHRYADRVGRELRSRGAIPFDRIGDRQRLLELGLRPEDFEVPNRAATG